MDFATRARKVVAEPGREYVAPTLAESANMAAGRPSNFPKLPAVVHPSSVACCSSGC